MHILSPTVVGLCGRDKQMHGKPSRLDHFSLSTPILEGPRFPFHCFLQLALQRQNVHKRANTARASILHNVSGCWSLPAETLPQVDMQGLLDP